MRVNVVVLLFFGVAVQGVLLPWSRNYGQKAGKDNLMSSSNKLLKKIGHKINRIFFYKMRLGSEWISWKQHTQ